MKVRVLGCSGGIGGSDRTSALLVDDDVLIDAGTGVGDLSLSALRALDHAFITHSHLDHVACLPMLVDSVGSQRQRPLNVYATEATIKILHENIFNWRVWPDFTRIPRASAPYMRFVPITLGNTVELGARQITALPANHVVPAVGYQLDSGGASLVFTGDTTSNDALWEIVNEIKNLRYLIIESAFPDRERDIAIASKHLCPSMLAVELQKLKRPAEIYITHIKPGERATIMGEIARLMGRFTPRELTNGTEFEL